MAGYWPNNVAVFLSDSAWQESRCYVRRFPPLPILTGSDIHRCHKKIAFRICSFSFSTVLTGHYLLSYIL